MSKTAKVTLTLEVTLSNEENPSLTKKELAQIAKGNLEELVQRALNEGLLSGHSEAIVDSYDYKIEKE